MKIPEKGSLLSYNNLVHAIAGSTGSVTAMTVFFPLDTVRSRLQLDDNLEAKNTPTMLMDLMKDEGFKTLYRGIVPVLQSVCASNFVYFYAFHGLKALQGAGDRNQSAVKDLLLAMVAGATNVIVTTPLWVVNTRLKMQGAHMRMECDPDLQKYKGMMDGLVKIPREEGISTLWSSTLPSLILVINPAIQFMVYEAVKRQLKAIYGDKQLGSLVYFTVGAVSKAIATILTYPLQLVQTKLRHGHTYQGVNRNAGMIQLLYYIFRKEGLLGLFKGMESKILQTVLTASLMFVVYEKIASFVFTLLIHSEVRKVPMK